MKKAAIIACAVSLLFTPRVAHAQVHLAVNDCGGAGAATWTCTSNNGTAVTMVASLVCPAGLAHVTGEESTIEIGFGRPVPEWWKSGAGQCRAAGSFVVGYMPSSAAESCMDYFGAVSAIVGSNSFQIGPDPATGDPNGPLDASRIRIHTLSAVDYYAALLAPAPAGGDEIFIVSLTINKAKTVGTGLCAGCLEPACGAIKRIKLSQASNIDSETVLNENDAGYVRMQGVDFVTGGCPHEVPASGHTWGQIKTLYR
jgi:hypothetical protein